ncbi:MAG: SLC13 family permease [Byssovorax sp.]
MTSAGPRHALRNVFVLAGASIAAGATTLVLVQRPGWPREAGLMAGIFVLAALLWVTEALPLFATALLVIGLEMILLANPGGWPGLGFSSGKSPNVAEVLHSAADPVLLLFFGGFLLARAAVKEGVDRALSSLLLAPFKGRPRWILLGVMAVTALFSMWMSNTATTAMMITLVVPMAAQLPPKEPFRRALVLAVPIAANLGGMGTPIASPPNAVAAGFLRAAGRPIGFLEWMLVAVPLMVALLVLMWLALWWLFRPRSAALRLELPQEPLTPRGWYVVSVFAATVLLWLTETWHGLPAPVVALLPAVAFTATRLLDRTDVNGIEWNVLILIAGGIALGAGMQRTGLDKMLIGQLPGTGPWLLAALVIATLLLSTFMSNTAAANLLLPIGISAAAASGEASATGHMAMSIALSASAAMALPVSTPPNAIAFASGEISTRDMALTGAIVGGIAAAAILALGEPVMRLWGFAAPELANP